MWPEKDPSTIDEMVEVLSEVEGINVYRSKDNPAVVRIIDERLEKEKDYELAKRVAVLFRGTPNGLVQKLADTSLKNLHDMFTIGGLPLSQTTDYKTRIRCSTHGSPARRALTDCLPLSHYNRLLWTAYTRRIDNKLNTYVFFWGPFPSALDKNSNGEVLFDIAHRRLTVSSRSTTARSPITTTPTPIR